VCSVEVVVVVEDEKKTTADPENSEQSVVEAEVDLQRQEADFALKLVDTLVSFNDQQISSYEIPNRFFTTEELNCFCLFANSLPINALPAIYPENGFLLFRGVPVPKSVNLTSSGLEEIEYILQSSNSIELKSLHLSDLAPDLLNSYQIATEIYNDKVSKVRASYIANVKNAKSQVLEISAAVVCGFVIILTLARLI
jgi:hypothetical protein